MNEFDLVLSPKALRLRPEELVRILEESIQFYKMLVKNYAKTLGVKEGFVIKAFLKIAQKTCPKIREDLGCVSTAALNQLTTSELESGVQCTAWVRENVYAAAITDCEDAKCVVQCLEAILQNTARSTKIQQEAAISR